MRGFLGAAVLLLISGCFDFSPTKFDCSDDPAICEPGTACVSDTCLSLCVTTANCGEDATLACVQGVCQPYVGGCDSVDTDCPDQWFCNGDNACQRRLTDGALCTEGRVCRSNSCEGGVCAPPVCGDGIIQDGEDCDDGNAEDDANGCTTDCLRPGSCGDGHLESLFEVCDDGNVSDGDYCSGDCQTQTGSCGDNILQSNEDCDDGNALVDGNGCSAACMRIGFCGDLAVQTLFEACDDGNAATGDYCSPNCMNVTGSCGDGELQSNEECDDGNALDDGNGCTSGCTRAGFCGNGSVEPLFEECDDGGIAGGDGCNGSCQEEAGWTCGSGVCEFRVIFVDLDASGANDGTSWTNAFVSLQDALDAASDGFEIWIAEGIYLPTTDNDRTIYFDLDANIEIRGSFAGTESSPEERALTIAPLTILSGDLNGDDSPSDPNINRSENSYHIAVVGSAVTSLAVEQIQISGGTDDLGPFTGTDAPFAWQPTNFANFTGATGIVLQGLGQVELRDVFFVGHGHHQALAGSGYQGAGFDGSLRIIGGRFADNDFGILVAGGTTYLEFVDFSNNSVGASVASGQVDNSTFINNGLGLEGGNSNTVILSDTIFDSNGLAIDGEYLAQTHLSNVTFIDNTWAAVLGGELDIRSSTFENNERSLDLADVTGVIRGSTIVGGDSTMPGSALNLASPRVCGCPVITQCDCATVPAPGSTLTVVSSTIVGNSTSSSGGAVWCEAEAQLSIVNSLFSGNVSENNGGAIFAENTCSVSVVSSTLSNNVATFSGQSINGGILNMRNSIVWGNSSAHIENVDGTSTVEYSNIMGGWTGTGNTSVDPMFVDANGADDTLGTEDDNLRLQSTSPLIDAGSNSALPMDDTDLDGDLDVSEPLPLDAGSETRQCDMPSIADTGEGTAPIVDMGAYEVCQ